MTIEWIDVEHKPYTAEWTVINGHLVTVCLDDEGPLRPAFYWDINDRAVDGWASSPARAKRDAIRTARALPPGPPNIWEDE